MRERPSRWERVWFKGEAIANRSLRHASDIGGWYYYRHLVAYYTERARMWHTETLHWRKEWSRELARAEQAEREREEARTALANQLVAQSMFDKEDR